MNKVFFCSDPHFNHANIIKYCNRPYSTVDQMNSDIIKKWNNTVGKEDVVWCLGDLGMGNKEKLSALIQSLNGKKRLIMGNHDNFSIQTYLDMGFEIVSPFPIIWHGIYILSHRPYENLPKGYINLYGHVHTSPKFETFTRDSACLCLDRFDLKPVEFKKICEGIKHNTNPKLQVYIDGANDPTLTEEIQVMF